MEQGNGERQVAWDIEAIQQKGFCSILIKDSLCLFQNWVDVEESVKLDNVDVSVVFLKEIWMLFRAVILTGIWLQFLWPLEP